MKLVSTYRSIAVFVRSGRFAPVRTTLTSNLNDCFFSFALNVNQTNRTWILDNLRFTP